MRFDKTTYWAHIRLFMVKYLNTRINKSFPRKSRVVNHWFDINSVSAGGFTFQRSKTKDVPWLVTPAAVLTTSKQTISGVRAFAPFPIYPVAKLTLFITGNSRREKHETRNFEMTHMWRGDRCVFASLRTERADWRVYKNVHLRRHSWARCCTWGLRGDTSIFYFFFYNSTLVKWTLQSSSACPHQ